jgi:glycosyltransferase involved in cell wall biosynthesis
MLSIIVPFHNEREGLLETVREIHRVRERLGVPSEVLLVDDGSTDGSADVLPQGDDSRVIRHDRNRGYGRAIQTGVDAARGDWIAILDADGSYPPSQLKDLWEARADTDMVVGRRDGGVPFLRRPAKWFLRRLAAILSEEKIPDLNSGMRIIRKDLFERYRSLLPDGFSLTTTLTLAFTCNRHAVRYVPIDYRPRLGKSKIRPISDTWKFLKLVIRLTLLFNPIKVLMPISVFLFLLAAVVLFVSKFVFKQLMDVTTTILFMLSIQVAVLAFLADLISAGKRR